MNLYIGWHLRSIKTTSAIAWKITVMLHPRRGCSQQTPMRHSNLPVMLTYVDWLQNQHSVCYFTVYACMHTDTQTHIHSCMSKKGLRAGFSQFMLFFRDTGGDRAALFARVCMVRAVTVVLLLSSHSALSLHTPITAQRGCSCHGNVVAT